MRYPAVIDEACDTKELRNGVWSRSRPLPYRTVFGRLRIAWRVFIGKYDAFRWNDDAVNAARRK